MEVLSIPADSPEAKEALAALAKVMATDGVTRFVARDGMELQFFSTLMHMFVSSEAYTLHVIPPLRCMALTHVIDPAHPPPPPPPVDQGPPRAEIQAAMAKGGVQPLLELGLPPEQAQLLAAVRPGRLKVLDQLESEVDVVMREYAQERGPLLHLLFITTAAEARGQGLGGVMLTHLGRLADEQGRWMYLEASSLDSRRLYERHGFQDARTYPLGDEPGGPIFHIMLRPPRAAPSST